MKTVSYLSILVILLFASCSKSEQSSCSVTIQLRLPEGCPTLPYEEIKVTLSNKDLGTTYTANSSASGFVTFRVEHGFYTASAYYQTFSGMIFSGRIESLSLLAEQGETAPNVELLLSQSSTNALVIKEIYYGGCLGKLGEEYIADQYVTLYNNSEKTIHLDGLCFGVVDPASRLKSPWMQYTDMNRIPVNDVTWQFPGSGKEYPLLPGTETTIATNAVDHTRGEYQHANSIDLSRVDWCFSTNGFDNQMNAGVKPMKLAANLNPSLWKYIFPVFGPTVMVFELQNTTVNAYVNNMENREPRPDNSNPSKRYLMIPKEWVIDCIDCVFNASEVNSKRVPNELDFGAVYLPDGLYKGQSLIRKRTISAEGRLNYQDTNNSTEDFNVSVPTLKNN